MYGGGYEEKPSKRRKLLWHFKEFLRSRKIHNKGYWQDMDLLSFHCFRVYHINEDSKLIK